MSKVGSIIITEPTLLISSKQSDSVKCFGGSTGSAKIIPSGGTPAYTYLWSTGATIDSITSRTANAYYVTMTDSKGCQKIDTINIYQPTCHCNFTSTNSVKCFATNQW
ncbi:MAG: SprB repeat-containing protein [Bacteroidetes bacterium]|nr:SprB repeat-containing protein [Bacteroidota bacterium]